MSSLEHQPGLSSHPGRQHMALAVPALSLSCWPLGTLQGHMACYGAMASHVPLLASPASTSCPWSPLCHPGWGCWCSCQDMHQSVPCTLCHGSQGPCMPHAPSLAQPQGSVPCTYSDTATAVPRAPVLSCGHPIRAAPGTGAPGHVVCSSGGDAPFPAFW